MGRELAKYGVTAHQDFDDEITMGGMLATAHPHECALLTYTLGLKPFLDRIDIVAIDEREVPRDFHHVYMVYKKEEFQNRALESFIDFALKFPVPEDVAFVVVSQTVILRRNEHRGSSLHGEMSAKGKVEFDMKSCPLK